ncbi:MAG: FHA domain-containing protein [Methylacidiphilales bacterium]|nr:FHA domain-containing protein [Candidatus Methylacidiphilales bacterium]
MDYWISINNNQMGPYRLEQLQAMWQQGQLTSDAYYYDSVRSEWLLLRELIESVRGLFTVEEAFVRLGQNRQRGCLSVYNTVETLHVFVDGGFVVCAMSDKDHGEFALSRALGLENSAYEWFYDANPPTKDIRVNIPEYALKHSIARDVRIANTATRKQNTVALPKVVRDKTEVKLNFTYVLVPNESPQQGIRLVKITHVVGREPYCDVVISNAQISRKHCLLEVSEQGLKVKDLESSNGTFVNDVPVRDGLLKVGDKLDLGRYRLILHKEQKRAPDAA